MSFSPLTNASLAIQIHAFAALTLIPLTIAIFSLKRGNRLHRTLGWCWVTLMALVAVTSFWIQEIRLLGGFSPIHLLSIFTLIALVRAVWFARRHQVSGHSKTMTWITYGALMGAGAFTLLPGRIMNAVLFGL